MSAAQWYLHLVMEFLQRKTVQQGKPCLFSAMISIMHESLPRMTEEWRQGPLSLLCFHSFQNATVITIFALYGGCYVCFFPALTSWHSSRWRHKIQKSQGFTSGWSQDQLWLLQLRFYLIKLLTAYSLKMSFPSRAFYSPHGGYLLIGPPHHYKQHA